MVSNGHRSVGIKPSPSPPIASGMVIAIRNRELVEIMRSSGYWADARRRACDVGWLKSKSRERRKKVRLDRKHLEDRARRFLKSYLEADEKQKPHFYRAVEDISKKCHPAALGLAQSDVDDSRIAENYGANGAMKMVLDRTAQRKMTGLETSFTAIKS